VATGLSPKALARAEAASEREVEALIAEPDFQELVEALREFEALPEEERLRELERCAWHILEMALADGDWRAAAFVADQIARGHNPARSLARGVIRSQARTPTPPAPPKPAEAPPPRRPRPYDPIAAALRRATATLRAATLEETVTVATPVASAPPNRPRLPLAARLRAGIAVVPPSQDLRGLQPAWPGAP
jgi:hypothetical protein